MRFIIMHKTTPAWEAGAVPGPDLIARVEAMIGGMQKAGVFVTGEGLRPTSQGARLQTRTGRTRVTAGPFAGDRELPAGFTIVRAASLDEAIAWAARQASTLGSDVQIDVRPVTEPWDIGLAPAPEPLTSRRYIILRKRGADDGTADGAASSSPFVDECTRAGVHVVTETVRPGSRGRRYVNSRDGVTVIDGPFAESKELLGGYIVLSAPSWDAIDPWARWYMDAVQPPEADVFELE